MQHKNMEIKDIPDLEMNTGLIKSSDLNSVEGIECVIGVIFHYSEE